MVLSVMTLGGAFIRGEGGIKLASPNPQGRGTNLVNSVLYTYTQSQEDKDKDTELSINH